MRSTLITTCILSVAAVGALGLVGCSDRPAPQAAPGIAAPTNDVPDWVNDPSQGGKVFGAYGVSEKKLSGEKTMRDQAMQSARQELAATIGSKIQAVVKDWVREGGVITSQDNAQAAMTSFETASRNFINQDLAGSQQRARYIEEKSGKMYLYVVVNPEITAKIAADAKAAARENKELRAHMAAKIEADKAFADLDKLIDKAMAEPGAK